MESEPFESVEEAVRAWLAKNPHLADSPRAASALAVAKAMGRKTTSLLAKELRDTLADLEAVEPPAMGELSDLDKVRARFAERRGA